MSDNERQKTIDEFQSEKSSLVARIIRISSFSTDRKSAGKCRVDTNSQSDYSGLY